MRPNRIVAVAGISSNVGKTTLACRLLERLPGWEAIKVTKGHYRSCGKDPHACCVSHLLSDAPLVMSGREQTYAPGKDTGRYWDAGASNVHWVVATKAQVAEGVREALSRVDAGAPGVVVEGTGFLSSVDVDFAVMVATEETTEMKASAASVFPRIDAVYVSRLVSGIESTSPASSSGSSSSAPSLDRLRERLAARRVDAAMPPVFVDADFDRLLALASHEAAHSTGRGSARVR
jgi:molybdopterin-guanine dinucleotide biosynthesis protein